MSMAQMMLPEFDQEMAKTRKVLERIPEDKLGWKAHPKSNTIGWNANHLAELPGWGNGTLTSESFDIAPPGGQRYQTPKLASRKEILDLFDQNVAATRKALAGMSDEQLAKPWSLLQGGKPMFTMPRTAVLRGFVLNHMIHHRAILSVYLRLNNIPVPAIYGPSGDDQPQ
jgi:uncharacterized damage-inducible protein DinB